MAQAYYAASALHPPARPGDQQERGRCELRRGYRFQLALGLAVGASVGVTLSEATEIDAVLREADVAMYMAKAHDKGRAELPASSAWKAGPGAQRRP
jgi:predicted signal transduction protein with EAL and GGDEF domain